MESESGRPPFPATEAAAEKSRAEGQGLEPPASSPVESRDRRHLDDFVPRHEYGYVTAQKVWSSSRERLTKLFAQGATATRVHRVWTPETGGLVPPWDVPFLVDAFSGYVRRRLRRRLRRTLGYALVGLLIGAVLRFTPGAEPLLPVLPIIGLISLGPLVVALARRLTLREHARALMAEREFAQRMAGLVSERDAWTTYGLVGTWGVLLVAAYVAGLGDAFEAAGLVKVGAPRDEFWRWGTAAFLHLGFLHLYFNAGAACVWAPLIEALCGRATLGLVFLASVLGGSAASWSLGSSVGSVGASGGLMGLLGFLLVLGHRRREHLPLGFGRRMLGSVVFIAAYGVALYRVIDNAAHGGGLVTGLVLGAALVRSDPDRVVRGVPALRVAGAFAWTALASFGILALVLVLLA